MESNKDEAERCLNIGEKYEQQCLYEEALKFYTKSERLYPSKSAKDRIAHVKELLTNSSKAPPNVEIKRESPQTSQQTTTTQKAYTEEQVELVAKIRKAKDYYEVLGVSREATEVEIKKKYKKLALLLHPDKNCAPGAEECFKKVGQAFSCISDPEKRKLYDARGTDEPISPSMRRAYDGDLTPEEIFAAMFFGADLQQLRRRRGATVRRESDFFGGSTFTTYTYSPGTGWRTSNGASARRAQRNEQEERTTTYYFCVQILVLLMFALFGLFAGPSEPAFSLHKTSRFHLARETSSGIQYFVKPDIDTEYNFGDSSVLKKFESAVEKAWINQKQTDCYYERQEKARLAKQARYYKSYQTRLDNFKTPACDALEAFMASG